MRLPVGVLLCGLLPVLAQPAAGVRNRRLEAAVEAERVRQGVVGLTIAAAMQGTRRWSGAFGKADLENDVPVRVSTLFRSGSLAKPITATAALQLWERGKLDLDAPVQKYVPSFPEKPWRITVRLLLGHLGGIRSYRGEELDSTHHYTDILGPLRMFSADALAHAPRSKYLYSSYGFNLVGAAVEAAAGEPFLEYLEENIFRIAKMESTRDDDTREIVPNRTRWYSRTKNGQIINAPLADTSNKIPGGGMLTTAEDLLRFAGAWEQEKLLKRSTMRMQTERQKLADGSATGYGLGWNVSPIAGKSAISHSGNVHGCRSLLVLFPESKTTIAVLSNSDFADAVKFVEIVLKTMEPQSNVSRVNSVRGVVARPN
ncbi:MAG TPA: serine hydrolase domain-containing protein [Bryobacteraceae bacterium]|nr:serine hydrolase domain-containing protein [Bryobacteraceae bacterium]